MGGSDRQSTRIVVSVLPTFSVRHGGVMVAVPRQERRLLAFLSVHPRPVARARIAFELWPDAEAPRATGTCGHACGGCAGCSPKP